MTSAYLGIDIGTSGVRGCCIDNNAAEIASKSLPIDPPDINGERIEQDPEIWWQAVREVIRSITSSLPDIDIVALAIDGTSGTVLLTDETGKPLSPALMYNDQSCTAEAETVANIAPENSAVHGASSALAKLLFLFHRFPEAKHLCHQADWVSSKLTGCFGRSDENNCLKTGYDPVARCWPKYIQKLGISATLLPEVTTTGTSIGIIKENIARSIGLPTNCEVIAGTTDSIAAFIATGAHETGIGVTSLGSTLSLKMITTKPVFSAKDGIYSHRLGDVWLTGGASNSGGKVLQQFFSQQRLDELSPLLDVSKRTRFKYYPLPEKGERFPINDANLESCITPKPDDERIFLQALLEGITRIEKLGYEKLQALSGTQLTKIITSGGGSTNTQWTKIRQNMIGIPVIKSEQTQASYGSALLAKQGCHKEQ